MTVTRKQLRKAMSPAGWTGVLYYLLINVCVFAVVLVDMLYSMLTEMSKGYFFDLQGIAEEAASNTWGYFLAAAIGLLILFAWKKPKFWREEIWAKGKPMKWGDFLGILCVFLSTQFIYQFVVIGLEMLLNGMGLTLMEGIESLSAGGDNLSMFLYMCILAPVTEELLCRGLIQRMLMPYGKRLAILGSAFLFGLFHGNILQAPYAFAVGLVLGYVAAEYSIAWAMLLHMINNLVLGDMFVRLTDGMNEVSAAILLWSILLVSAVGAVVTLIRKRREVRDWMNRNAMGPTHAKCFFSSAGVITFTVLMTLSMIGTCFMLITPLS